MVHILSFGDASYEVEVVEVGARQYVGGGFDVPMTLKCKHRLQEDTIYRLRPPYPAADGGKIDVVYIPEGCQDWRDGIFYGLGT